MSIGTQKIVPPRGFAVTGLSLLLALLLAACGGGSRTTDQPTAGPSATQATQEEPTEATQEEPTEATQEDATPQPDEEPTAAPQESEAKLLEATFANKLGENMEPEEPNPSKEFQQEDTIYLSLQFEGRPESGVVKSTFFWGDEEIANTSVDMAEANSGVLFSFGQSTYVGFNLKPNQPWPVSTNYRVDVELDGQPLGSYEYSVVPPTDAIPTKLGTATLAEGADDNYEPVNPTDTFATADKVFLVATVDLGTGSWARAHWYVDGQLDPAGTRLLGPVDQNNPEVNMSFSYLPEGGWPAGEHEVALILDDQEVGRYSFTVSP
ncbi:MAG TPA: hypothetical protein VFS21_39680 [Roseiflexaceae bacterium]|nr:hypothetical protein [Roseiflexaceae bacterium]